MGVMTPAKVQPAGPDWAEDIRHVRASLAEGFCPAGDGELSVGGGVWGTCDTCGTSWAVNVPGYSRRSFRGVRNGYWMVTERGQVWQFEETAAGRQS